MRTLPCTIAAALALGGCGGGLSGTYVCKDVGPVDRIELTSDGKIYAEANVYGVEQRTAGTYEIDGERLVSSVNGSSTVFGIDGGDLTYGNGRCTKD